MTDKEKLLQEKYLEFQLLERQIKQVQAHLEQLEQQMTEMVVLQHNLGEMKDVVVGKELFVPLGSGVFVNASLKDNKEVLVNVGAGVVVKKSCDDAVVILAQHIGELRSAQEERAHLLDELSHRAGSIEQELAGLVEGA
ncbi:prefoldin subunit alpha [Candidatus Woesearchaeota archaeon]|nr:prefoldin subunit alpha [Candidatus Woesearchaeota archaeon]